MKVNWSEWRHAENPSPWEFVCGYCGKHVGSHIGYKNNSNQNCRIYICTNCGCPTLYFDGNQYPGPLIGRVIQNLPVDIAAVYKEIRDSIKNASYTAAVLLGRKLIMHLAVNVAGAKEGEKFVVYVEHLKTSGYIPPNGAGILKYIKDIGNEKNHEIKVGTKDEAEKMLKFVEGLLIFMYEFPSEIDSV